MMPVSEINKHDNVFAEQNEHLNKRIQENIKMGTLGDKTPLVLSQENGLKSDDLSVNHTYLSNINRNDFTDSVLNVAEFEAGISSVDNSLTASFKNSNKYHSTMFLFPTPEDTVQSTADCEDPFINENLEIMERHSLSSSIEAASNQPDLSVSIVSSEAPSEQDTSEDIYYSPKEMESSDDAYESALETDAGTTIFVPIGVTKKITSLPGRYMGHEDRIEPVQGTLVQNYLDGGMETKFQTSDSKYSEKNALKQNAIIVETLDHEFINKKNDDKSEHDSNVQIFRDVSTSNSQQPICEKHIVNSYEAQVEKPGDCKPSYITPKSSVDIANALRYSDELLDKLTSMSLLSDLSNTSQTTDATEFSGRVSPISASHSESWIQNRMTDLEDDVAKYCELSNPHTTLIDIGDDKNFIKLNEVSRGMNTVEVSGVIKTVELTIDNQYDQRDNFLMDNVEIGSLAMPLLQPNSQLLYKINCNENQIKNYDEFAIFECPALIKIEDHISAELSQVDLAMENVQPDWSESTGEELTHLINAGEHVPLESRLQKRVRFSFEEMNSVNINNDRLHRDSKDNVQARVSLDINKNGWSDIHSNDYKEVAVENLPTDLQGSVDESVITIQHTSMENISKEESSVSGVSNELPSESRGGTEMPVTSHFQDTSILKARGIDKLCNVHTDEPSKECLDRNVLHFDVIDSAGSSNVEECNKQNDWCTMEVEIEKGVTGLGFCIAGGVDSLVGKTPITVKRIFNGKYL